MAFVADIHAAWAQVENLAREGSRWLRAGKTCYDFAWSCYAMQRKQGKTVAPDCASHRFRGARHQQSSIHLRPQAEMIRWKRFLTRWLTAPDTGVPPESPQLGAAETRFGFRLNPGLAGRGSAARNAWCRPSAPRPVRGTQRRRAVQRSASDRARAPRQWRQTDPSRVQPGRPVTSCHTRPATP